MNVPAELWNEEGTRVWLRRDTCATASKARYKAWTGEGMDGQLDADSLIDLRVRVVWARYAPDSPGDEWPWKPSAKDEDGSACFWEVS